MAQECEDDRRPVAASQIFTVLSSPAEARPVPSGLNATPCTKEMLTIEGMHLPAGGRVPELHSPIRGWPRRPAFRSGLNATLVIGGRMPPTDRGAHGLSPGQHNLATSDDEPMLLTEASRVPSGENATDSPGLSWLVRVRDSRPVGERPRG